MPGVKLPQMKKALPNIKSVFITLRKKIYPRLPNILHLPSICVKGTGAWGKITPNEMVHFHKALPNVKSAYVTVRKFTPDLQNFYTDISAISVTFPNSAFREGFLLSARLLSSSLLFLSPFLAMPLVWGHPKFLVKCLVYCNYVKPLEMNFPYISANFENIMGFKQHLGTFLAS